MTAQNTIAILGASGNVGRAAVDVALARGHHVIAINHSMPDNAPTVGVTYRFADVMADDLAPVLVDADAVISCIGLPLNPKTAHDPPPLYTQGTRRIAEAMRANGQRRLLVISASFVERIGGPVWFNAVAQAALGAIFRQMAEMEEMLHATPDLDWTAVRPGWLLDEPASGDVVITHNTIPEGFLRTRIPDLARFMVRLAEGGRWQRGTPAIATREDFEHTGPHALERELD